MKFAALPLAPVLALAFVASPGLLLLAGPRTSTNYEVTTEIVAGGGGRSSSQNYSQDASFGSIGGTSTAAQPAPEGIVNRQGYVAQLYEVVGLTVAVASTTDSVNETSTAQLHAWENLDDSTYIRVAPESVTWSLISGPVTGVQSSGQFTTGPVYTHTPAGIQGSLRGFTGSTLFSVKNNNTDNFGSYAGDGLPDDWQVAHFGLDNAQAKPGLDADGDGYLNGAEYLAGTLPVDPLSHFRLKVIRPQVQAPVLLEWASLTGRTYEVQRSFSLVEDSWETLTTLPGTGQTLQWTATRNLGPQIFYRVIVRF